MGVLSLKGFVGFKSGLYIGTALGYLLGAKLGLETGRARFQQLRGFVQSAARSSPVERLGELADRATQRLEARAESSVGTVTELVRETYARSNARSSNGAPPHAG